MDINIYIIFHTYVEWHSLGSGKGVRTGVGTDAGKGVGTGGGEGAPVGDSHGAAATTHTKVVNLKTYTCIIIIMILHTN